MLLGAATNASACRTPFVDEQRAIAAHADHDGRGAELPEVAGGGDGVAEGRERSPDACASSSAFGFIIRTGTQAREQRRPAAVEREPRTALSSRLAESGVESLTHSAGQAARTEYPYSAARRVDDRDQQPIRLLV